MILNNYFYFHTSNHFVVKKYVSLFSNCGYVILELNLSNGITTLTALDFVFIEVSSICYCMHAALLINCPVLKGNYFWKLQKQFSFQLTEEIMNGLANKSFKTHDFCTAIYLFKSSKPFEKR